MNKSSIVKPTGLKGEEKNNRMRELMNLTPIKETVNKSVVELTKKGPNGLVYGIVRENHEYYIKSTDKTENITTNDFNYIGGLQNKKDFAFPSYSAALKRLNLKFISLNEALGKTEAINVFKDDNLLSEGTPSYKNYGQVDNEAHVIEKKGEKLEMEASVGEDTGSNLTGKKGTKKAANDFTKVGEVKLTENEKAIDEMISGKEEEEIVEESDEIVIEGKMKIENAHNVIDDAISEFTGEKKLTEMSTAKELLKKMSKAEVISILEDITLKKKV